MKRYRPGSRMDVDGMAAAAFLFLSVLYLLAVWFFLPRGA